MSKNKPSKKKNYIASAFPLYYGVTLKIQENNILYKIYYHF